MRDRRSPVIEEGPSRDDLLRQIGQLQMDLEYLKKKSLQLDLMRSVR